MTMLVWTGTILALMGLSAVMWCVFAAVSAKRAGLEDGALRARLQRVVTVNMAALLASALGLMAVVVGVMLA